VFYRDTQSPLLEPTTLPCEFRISAVTSAPARAWTNEAAMRVAPSRTSPGSLSKSNSTSPPTACRVPVVAVPPAARTRARKAPPAGLRLLPSTEIFERFERRSQRSRMLPVEV